MIFEILPHTYKVLYPYEFKERSDSFGQSDHALLEIRLKERDCGGVILPAARVMECLMHEIMHCVDAIYNSQGLGEEVISRLSNGLYQVWVDHCSGGIENGR